MARIKKDSGSVEPTIKTKLTANFTLEELCTTNQPLDNTPSESVKSNLLRVAKVLEVIRSFAGDKPVIISSGYRSKDVNEAVGGSATSDHVKGLAVDFNIKGMSAYDVCLMINNCPSIKFSQLILEYRNNGKTEWVHLSIAGEKREVFTMTSPRTKLNGLQNQK